MGRRYGKGLVLVAGMLIGCGSSGARNDGAAGSGAAGTSGVGVAGAGGSGGGAGGAVGGGSGSAGTGGGLPACAIASRPDDPLNPDGGIATGCNTAAFGADWVSPEAFVANDAGVALDGGATEEPLGGSMLDGDYDLVRFRTMSTGGGRTRRSLRFFDGGTFIEWLVGQETSIGDGGVMTGQVAINTRQQPSAPAPFGVTIICGNPELIGPDFTYSYTVTGDELVLFNYYMGRLVNVYTYRRACSR
ncbi:MAG TPA: hypothetical protein VKQ32_10905 [Polyangia bacterium]|nr:hypothetical protein [Polyangia bacterium]